MTRMESLLRMLRWSVGKFIGLISLSLAAVVVVLYLNTSPRRFSAILPIGAQGVLSGQSRLSGQPPLDTACWRQYQEQMETAETKNFIAGKTIMMDGESVRLLCSFLRATDDVLEWGSGGSTLFFYKFVRSWHSVEHDPAWARTMLTHTRSLANVRLEAVPVAKGRYYYEGHYDVFRDYVERPKTFGKRYSVIIIDGRSRVSCARAVIRNRLLASRDSLVIFHDWQRAAYQQVLDDYALVAEDARSRRHLAVLRPKTTDVGRLPEPHDPFPGVTRVVCITTATSAAGSALAATLAAQHVPLERVTAITVASHVGRRQRVENHIAAVQRAISLATGSGVVIVEESARFAGSAQQTTTTFWEAWEQTEVRRSWSVLLLAGAPAASTRATHETGVVQLTGDRAALSPPVGYAVRRTYLPAMLAFLQRLRRQLAASPGGPAAAGANTAGTWFALTPPLIVDGGNRSTAAIT